MIEGVTIPNGMSWSRDDKTLYFTDSAERTIFAYDFDPPTGSISNRRVLFSVDDDDSGTPDGHAADEEGNLWVAIWGAWKVVRVSPEGQVTAEVRLPTRCITVSVGKNIVCLISRSTFSQNSRASLPARISTSRANMIQKPTNTPSRNDTRATCSSVTLGWEDARRLPPGYEARRDVCT